MLLLQRRIRRARARKSKRFNIDKVGAITGGMGVTCSYLGVGGPFSNGHKQDENAYIDEITDCAKIAARLYMRTLPTSSA
jgi:acetylornithine deacetylase/succinyl-diaminopimelate desuccinylase-like protein